MTDEQLAVEFAEKVLGLHLEDRLNVPMWVTSDGKPRYSQGPVRLLDYPILDPCTDLDQAMEGVKKALQTDCIDFSLRSLEDGLWRCTLVDSEGIRHKRDGSRPARAIVKVCLAAGEETEQGKE